MQQDAKGTYSNGQCRPSRQSLAFREKRTAFLFFISLLFFSFLFWRRYHTTQLALNSLIRGQDDLERQVLLYPSNAGITSAYHHSWLLLEGSNPGRPHGKQALCQLSPSCSFKPTAVHLILIRSFPPVQPSFVATIFCSAVLSFTCSCLSVCFF